MIKSNICSFKLCRQYLKKSWWFRCMMPETVTWVRSPARIGAACSKILPLNDLACRFLIKHLHICYKFFHRISDQEVCLAMLHQIIVFQNKFYNFSPNIFVLLRYFGHLKNISILGYIFKGLNSRHEN